jgi:hypothetical protein
MIRHAVAGKMGGDELFGILGDVVEGLGERLL